MNMTFIPRGKWANSDKKRDISDLYTDENGIIWSVATEDNGDNGPFRSVIYKAAIISITKSAIPILRISLEKASWIIDGFKIESLAAPPAVIKDAVLSIGTEDENFDGTRHPLCPSVE